MNIIEGNRNQALSILRINKEEQIAFITYLNYAVNNICKVAGIDISDESAVRGALYRGSPDDINKRFDKLGDFLWIFREKEPTNQESGYKKKFAQKYKNGYKDIILSVTKKIFELRNFFSHVNVPNSDILIIDYEDYVLYEGILGGMAREAAIGPRLNPAKVQKLKLATSHIKNDKSYEFTRKGLIFITCLGLYKDEAEEFCRLFPEMKKPEDFADEGLFEVFEGGTRRRVLGSSDIDAFKGLKGKGLALTEFFTYFSYRRGRQSLAMNNLDFMSFADIVGYLNKVPAPAFDFLNLDEERKALQRESELSSESEKNKLTKYDLRRRDKDRFISMAAAYCEDFNVFPETIKFKRLDVRQTTGRSQYIFGKDSDAGDAEEAGNRVRLNRHYVIKNEAIAFSFTPKEHYGDIKISSLRSQICATELRNLIYAHSCKKDVGKTLEDYFTAYHRVLERMINLQDVEDLTFDDADFLKDFALICNMPESEIKADPSKMRPFVMDSLANCFVGRSGELTDKEMLEKLNKKLNALYNNAYNTLVRYDTFKNWKSESRPWNRVRDEWRKAIDLYRKNNAEKPLPDNLKTLESYLETIPQPARPRKPELPKCRIGDGEYEVSNPPTDCFFSDANYTALVLDYLNLHLAPERKFRQLPLSEQHREGIEDFLYQMVHTAIGKYSLDKKSLWQLLEKKRPELEPIVKGLKRQSNLEDLAVAALEKTKEYYENQLDVWEAPDVLVREGRENLKKACRRLGVRLGLPINKNALLKLVLHIDYDRWVRAYDYERQCPYKDRKLADKEHIATQIPLPKGFSDRLSDELGKNPQLSGFILEKGDTRVFDFNGALRLWKPHKTVTLRRFYEKDEIRVAVEEKKKSGNRITKLALLEANRLDSLRREIADVENRDKILLFIAMKYWDRFQASDTFASYAIPYTEQTTLKGFFDAQIKIAIGNIKVVIHPNDINKPIFPVICGSTKENQDIREKIVKLLCPDGSSKEFNFNDLAIAYREQKARDRVARLRFIPFVISFESICPINRLEYSAAIKGISDKAEREKKIHEMEFEKYSQYFTSFSQEDYEVIVKARNEAFHNGFGVDFSKALQVCNRLGICGY